MRIDKLMLPCVLTSYTHLTSVKDVPSSKHVEAPDLLANVTPQWQRVVPNERVDAREKLWIDWPALAHFPLQDGGHVLVQSLPPAVNYLCTSQAAAASTGSSLQLSPSQDAPWQSERPKAQCTREQSCRPTWLSSCVKRVSPVKVWVWSAGGPRGH